MNPQLAALGELQLTRVREAGALAVFDGASPALREALPRVLTASDFATMSLARDVGLATWLVDQAEIQRGLAQGEMLQRVQTAVAGVPDLAGFMAALRRQRTREMVRIAWRDLAGWATLVETLADTSAFADAAIQVACDYAAQDLAHIYGEPRNPAGVPQPLIVLGMGKLGG